MPGQARRQDTAGGFTLDDAEAVASDARLPARGVAAHLSALVAQSLVQLEEIYPERGRYRVLEPLRQYARARLSERGEAATTAERHARHHLALIEAAEPSFYQAGSVPWLERIRVENENRRGALQWAFGPDGDGQLGARMAASCSGTPGTWRAPAPRGCTGSTPG